MRQNGDYGKKQWRHGLIGVAAFHSKRHLPELLLLHNNTFATLILILIHMNTLLTLILMIIIHKHQYQYLSYTSSDSNVYGSSIK